MHSRVVQPSGSAHLRWDIPGMVETTSGLGHLTAALRTLPGERFIHLFIQQVLRSYYVPGIVLSAG